ncbi:MAG: hypothetical protein KAS32_07135 [Candidatus Peribacteraceae bacterium]|nr:hypothetical protein [Candidatus Peribacteraceae bacterium]
MKLVAVVDKIITKEIIQEIKSPGGIVMPEEVAEKMITYFKGEVISVGEKVEKINVGDVVFTTQGHGLPLVIDGEMFRMLHIGEVFGIMKEE